jgi:hypothetical protein
VLIVVDVSDPVAPVEVRRIVLESVTDVEVAGEVLYVTSHDPWEGGVFIDDISVPRNPRLLGTYEEPWQSFWEIDVQGSFAYLSDFESVRLLSVADPTAPVMLDEHRLSASMMGLTGDGAYIYAANGTVGI